MQAVKAVNQSYAPSPELLHVMDEFRRMVNHCIGLGLAENLTSMKALSKKAYHQLAGFNVPTYYRLTAISKAAGILRNYRYALRKHSKVRKPYARRLMLTDCYGFKIAQGRLRLPIRAREYVFIPLNAYVFRCIEGYTVRSICLTACTLSIAFSKETAPIEPTGLIGIDRNLDNVTTASSDKLVERHDLSRATKIKERCRQVKRGFKRNDLRVRRRLYSKYGRIENNRSNWLLHNASKDIVENAKQKRFGIVMENLKDIRKLYRRGNGQSRDYRARMNSWSYAELQRQIEYKAKWEGIPVFYVNSPKTSSLCAMCGCRVAECAGRRVYCPHCRRLVDRDENAAMNILNAGLRFSLEWVTGEVMNGNPEKVIPGADATQLSLQPKT